MANVKTTLKAVITIILGLSLLILFVIQAVPTMLGNTTFTMWIGGTNYVWVADIFLFFMFIIALIKTFDLL